MPRNAQPLTVLTEELGQLLGGVTFLMFGAVLLGGVPQDFDSYAVFYGILSSSAVRMIPVALGLSRTRARPATVAFVRWFGPVVSLRGCSW
jgi:hypothetical protein